MSRVRMSNISDQPLNLSNEIIDLTGDSPAVNSNRLRSRIRNASQYSRTNNYAARNIPSHHNLPIPFLYDPLTSIERDDSYIQVIDADEAQLMTHGLRNEEELKGTNSAKSNEEYSTAVPCLNDSRTGEQIVLSCPICFEALSAERKPLTTRCGHIFCFECLKSALERSGSKSCPKCNSTVKIKSCIRLYF